MKNIVKICMFLGLSLMFFSSCEDFLSEKPKSTIAPELFYTTDAEANAGAIGCYSKLVRMYMGPQTPFSWDANYRIMLGTDLALPTDHREMMFNFHAYNQTAAIDDSDDMWLYLYRGIADANNLIEKVGASKGVSDQLKAQIVAEGKMYRAFYYYYLTNFYGDVPFVDKFDISYAGSQLERTNVSEIRKRMIADLEESADDLPSVSKKEYRGRPTKWAAKILLCKYYMWEKEWQKASNLCEQIITQSPHKLLAEYKDIWGEKNEYNEESIWEFDFVQHINPSARCSAMLPRGRDEKAKDPALQKLFVGFGLLTVAEDFLNSFEEGDKRKIWYDWLSDDPRVDFNYHYVAKFVEDAPEKFIRNNSGVNIMYFRLADAYLMQAEAENELNNGPSQKAFDRMNTIRNRAGLKNLSASTNKEEFFQEVMNERKWELAFEYHRRFDLCRWGKLIDVVKASGSFNPIGASQIKPCHALYPIPPKEIVKNPKLKQNPGY